MPFAIDEGSNFFCIDESGKIYFYAIDAWNEDLNNEENKKAATKYIATSLNDFLKNLKSKIIKQ